MSFQSRQKKRRYKSAVRQAKREHTAETARRWFLTLARKDGACSCCGDVFRRGAEIVYRHEPRDMRCVRCAGRDPESSAYRPSIRWEKARPKRGSKRASEAPLRGVDSVVHR